MIVSYEEEFLIDSSDPNRQHKQPKKFPRQAVSLPGELVPLSILSKQPVAFSVYLLPLKSFLRHDVWIF